MRPGEEFDVAHGFIPDNCIMNGSANSMDVFEGFFIQLDMSQSIICQESLFLVSLILKGSKKGYLFHCLPCTSGYSIFGEVVGH